MKFNMSNTNKYQYDKANADHHANQLNRNKGTSELIREIAKAQEILISKKKLTSINDRLLYLSNGVLW
ncbi:hypothetical protein AWS29_16565 [Enterobacter hormaechei subsp. steigerwaltii]|nr:hypothetical protein AWS29_16565 [Enterobacter hormaechei subsp. steigerwaltii]URZ94517.1 Hypothetical protein [Raoultella ornithinolytica]